MLRYLTYSNNQLRFTYLLRISVMTAKRRAADGSIRVLLAFIFYYSIVADSYFLSSLEEPEFGFSI